MSSLRQSLLLAGAACIAIGAFFFVSASRTTLAEQLRIVSPDAFAMSRPQLACQPWFSAEMLNEATDTEVNEAMARFDCNSARSELVKSRHGHTVSPDEWRVF
jgi:hypothetical protein